MIQDTSVLQHELDRATCRLRASEARFHSLVTRNADGFLILDQNGVVQYANPAAETLLGRAANSLLGSPFEFPAAPDETVELNIAGRGGETSTLEMRVSETQWDGAPAHLASLRDITPRRRVQEEEHQQRTLAEALRDIASSLNSDLDFDEVLDRILTNVERIVPHDAASILLVESGEARIVRYHGYQERGQEAWASKLRFDVGKTPTLRQMSRSGQSIAVPDTHADPDWIELPEVSWVRSVAGAPIRTKGQVVGFLTLVSATPGFFTPAHAQRLQIFADQAAVAIGNARLHQSAFAAAESRAILYRASQEIAASLDPEQVYATTHRAARQLMPSEAFVIGLLDKSRQEIELVYLVDRSGRVSPQRLPVGHGLSGHVIATGQALRIHDVEHISEPNVIHFGHPEHVRSVLAVPMRRGNQVFGMLSAQSYQVGVYTQDDQQALSMLANQAASAIQNARLFESERAAREQAEALSEVARAVSSSLDRNEVLRRSLEHLRRLLAVDTASVYVFGEGIRAELVAGIGYVDEDLTSQAGGNLLDSSPILQQMSIDLQPVLCPDVRELDDWVWVPGAEHVRSFIGVPLIARSQMIGALMMDSAKTNFFDEAALRVAQNLARHVAVAVENARLFEAAQRRLAEQTALLAASTAIASSLDLSTVLSRLAEQMGRAIDVTSVYIGDWDAAARTSTILAEYYGADASPQERVSDLGVTYVLPRDFGEGYDRWLRVGEVAVCHVDDFDLPEPTRAHLVQYDGRSLLSIPLAVKDAVVGYAQLWESRQRREFTPDEIALCQGIARQAAVAFDHAQLFEAERRQRREIEAVHQASLSLTESLELPLILDAMLDAVLDLLPFQDAHIFLYANDRLTFGAARMPGTRLTGPSAQPRPEGLTHTVARSGEAIIVEDSRHHPLFANAPADWSPFAIVALPLKIGVTVVGVMNVAYHTPHCFAESELRLLNLLAAQAAIAIQNARLHDQAQRHAAELEWRVAERTAELERQSQRMQAILDSAGEGIILTDRDWKIEYANAASERITGYTAAESVGQTPRLWKSGRTPRATYDEMNRTLARGETWQGELINQHKNGRFYDASLTITPLRGSRDVFNGLVIVQRDISRLKELDHLKDQFVSNVSHELRTPLANVKLYLDLLEHGRPEKREQYMQTLHRESTRLKQLIEDLLDLSRLDLGTMPIQLIPTDLNQLAADLIVDRTALAAARGLSLDFEPADRLPPALADASMITQVMANLTANAINYTPRGGLVTLSTAIRSRDDSDWVTFTVRDSGPGISAADLPRLFERFFRGEAGRASGAPGTGLGLAICREIIDRLGGSITVDSRPGQGASFTAWLKLARESAA